MSKITTLFLRIIIMLAVGLLGLELARQAYFYPRIPAADYLPPPNRAEAWQQDLDYLRTYVALNRPYTAEARTVTLDLIDALTNNIDNLSNAELKLDITIPFTFEAYVMGQDAAMKQILEAHNSASAR